VDGGQQGALLALIGSVETGSTGVDGTLAPVDRASQYLDVFLQDYEIEIAR